MPFLKLSALCIIVLALVGCSPNKYWIYREIITDCPKYSSALLTSLPHNSFSGIEVQLLKGDFGTLGYLNVYANQIHPLKKDPSLSIVVFVIDEHQYIYQGVRMEGDQRLLLPDEATQHLICSLLENKKVSILLEGFITELSPQRFQAYYAKFQRV